MYLRKPSLILKIMLESKWKIVTISSAGECAEKLSLSQIASGNVKWYSHPGRQFGSFLKNFTFTYQMSHHSHSWISQKKMKHVHVKTCMWLFIATFGNSPKLESPLDCKEIKPVNPKGNQSWLFIERTDTKAEALILKLPDAKSGLIEKDPDGGKDWRQKEKRVAEGEMVREHYWLGYGFEPTPGYSERQGSLACCMQSMGSQKVRRDLATEEQQSASI